MLFRSKLASRDAVQKVVVGGFDKILRAMTAVQPIRLPKMFRPEVHLSEHRYAGTERIRGRALCDKRDYRCIAEPLWHVRVRKI